MSFGRLALLLTEDLKVSGSIPRGGLFLQQQDSHQENVVYLFLDC